MSSVRSAQKGRSWTTHSLPEALGLRSSGELISLVGGGGKSALLFGLARTAAERETLEELELDLSCASPIGQLSDVLGHAESIRVSGFVYSIEGDPKLVPNYEVREAFWSPLSHFTDPERQEEREFGYLDQSMPLPCVRLLKDQRAPVLWGITYKFMDDFMKIIGRPIPYMPWEENDL